MNYQERLQRLQNLVAHADCDAYLIEHPINLLYLTGLDMSAGQLIVSAYEAALFVDGRYSEKAKQQSYFPVIELKKEKLQEWLDTHQTNILGFDQQTTSYERAMELQTLQNISILPLASLVERLRLIKDPDEISALKAAADLGNEGFQHIKSLLKEGVTEEELAFELEFFWKKKGAKKLAFDAIIAFGPNASMPHYRAGKTALQMNQSVLIDIGVVVDYYHSDMTRNVFFGTPHPEIQIIEQIVAEAQKKAIELCRPGTIIEDLDRAARDWITSKGYGEAFSHSLGHGVGLEIHEMPRISSTSPQARLSLEEGMVITIEPGIYLPGVGGIRIEDTVLITKSGHEILT